MKPRPLGGLSSCHDLAELAALAFVDDLARDADAVEAGHQDEVSARDADVGREGRPLGADALLDDLDQDLVAAAEDLLDRRLDQAAAAAAPPAAAGLVDGRGRGPRRPAEAHLALELLDLLDLLADLLLELGVDLLLDGRARAPR